MSGPRGDPLEAALAEFAAAWLDGKTPDPGEFCRARPDCGPELRERIEGFLSTASTEGVGASESSGTRGGGAEEARFEGLEILEEIAPGLGGMGMVFKARERSLDRIVAVKTVKEHLRTPEGRLWFEQEARAAAALDHPHIVKIFRFEPDRTPPYYVMQFVDGRPIDEACAGTGMRFRAEVVEKIARSLGFAHDRGVVHRDIKPANILLDSDGEPHITDFGLAKRLGPLTDAPRIDTTTFKGTPLYVAPEVYQDPARSGPSADVYALGVTLFVLLCGRPPFEGRNLLELRERVLRADPPLPQELDPAVPEPLQRVCLKAMEPNPKDRYPSAKAMADDLRRFLEDREVLARPRRYQVELRGRLHGHLSDVQLWREQRLIETEEMDRLARPYERLLEDDSPWQGLSRRYPWETLCLRLGGWLVLLASVLWPVFYWERLSRVERVASIGLPALILNAAGWFCHRRQIRSNAVIFLTGGALLVPILTAVVVSEYDLLALPQAPAREAMEDRPLLRHYAGREPIPAPDPRWAAWFRLRSPNPDPSTEDPTVREWRRKIEALPPPGEGDFVASNFQFTLSAATFLAYAIGLLRVVRARIFVLLIGGGTYVLHAWVLTLAGLREWAEADNLTRAVLLTLPIPVVFVLASHLLRRRGEAGWAALFYAFFPVPITCLLTALAHTGGTEWILGRPGADFDQEAVQLWLMANGLLYFGLALRSAKAASRHVRFWGSIFLGLVPLSFLVPCNVLFGKGPLIVAELGGEDLRLYELLSATFGVLFIALGTRLHWPRVTMAGAGGTAYFLVRATDHHFRETLRWPVALVCLGALAMAVGVTVATVRARKQAQGA